MTHPIIQVTDLKKVYKDVVAVDNVSFAIEKGQCFGLLGPNGAGKTTTIEIMEGIIPATEGKILYYNKLAAPDIAQQIGIQFQHTALQDFLTVQETLNLFIAFYEKTMPIAQLVEMCDLGEFLDRDNRLLSGGQRQRLLLALALVNDPAIVFLDEPTTGLDPQARRNFWQLIKRIKASDKTVILTTHYMDEAEQLCDEIVIMDRGKVIERGTPPQLLTKHFSQVFAYLPAQQVPKALCELHQWQSIGDRIEIKTDKIEQTMALLIAEQVPLDGLHVKSANLDDLFLKLTGHSLRE